MDRIQQRNKLMDRVIEVVNGKLFKKETHDLSLIKICRHTACADLPAASLSP